MKRSETGESEFEGKEKDNRGSKVVTQIREGVLDSGRDRVPNTRGRERRRGLDKLRG